MKGTIFDNYDVTTAFDDVKRDLIDYGGAEEPSDDIVWDAVSEREEMEWDMAMDNLNRLFGDNMVLVKGTAGRWTGKAEVINYFDNIASAIQSIIEDCDYIKIEIDCDVNEAYVECSHHDGTNDVAIRIMTDEDYRKYDAWVYDDYQKEMTKYQILNAIWEKTI